MTLSNDDRDGRRRSGQVGGRFSAMLMSAAACVAVWFNLAVPGFTAAADQPVGAAQQHAQSGHVAEDDPGHAAGDHAAGDHATGEHPDHGGDHGHDGHHSEIGANPPPGVSREDFESPAEFRGDLAIWSFVVFMLLMVLLTGIAWKPIMEGLEKREQGIADMIASTQAANDDAKELLASYERRLAEASEEVKTMLDEARRDADSLRQSIVSEARQAAEEEKHRAQREIGMARDEAIARLAEQAGELAVGVAGKFLREKLNEEEQQRLVRDSLASLGSSPSIN